MGVIIQDTNGADAVCGHVIVPGAPSTAENTAAGNLAARLDALTLRIVIPSGPSAANSVAYTQPSSNLWIGRASLPTVPVRVDQLLSEL